MLAVILKVSDIPSGLYFLFYKVSGLSEKLGRSLNFFDGWPTWGIVMCLGTITAGITEFTSNTAIASIFLPIVASVVSWSMHTSYTNLTLKSQ